MSPLRRILRAIDARALAKALPPEIQALVRRDYAGLPLADPSNADVIRAAMHWLAHAQDQSATSDGGIARAFHLVSGWQSSYPETTGYIIPTFLAQDEREDRGELVQRARRMLDWLRCIQLPCGGFQGGRIDALPVVPVAFNTGQILLGLAAGARHWDEYLPAMRHAADWLVSIQDEDGCWRRHQSPFAVAGEKTYDTHSAWALLEAARVDASRGYGEAALKQVRWALKHQRPNGWFDMCCISHAHRPLTHTLGYALRGVLEAYRYSNEPTFLRAATVTANGLLSALGNDGFLPGQLTSRWKGAAKWACLTGNAQVAHCWLMLYQITGDAQWRDAAFRANRFVRRTIGLSDPPDRCGAVAGSFPIDGAYSRLEYPNWAAKFLVDSLRLEQKVRRDSGSG